MRWPAFEGAIRCKPDFAPAHDSLGSALNDMGKHEEAILCYDEAIRLMPGFAEALYNKANSLYRMDRIEESSWLLGEAVLLNPELLNHAGIRRMLDERLEFKRGIRGARDDPPGQP